MNADGRAIGWYARARFFKGGSEEAFEDSADGLPLGQVPKDHMFEGLPAIAGQVVRWAHEALAPRAIKGLTPGDMRRYTRSIRPTLSRNKGKAAWRIWFDTEETWSAEPGHKPAFLVRVDLEKAT